MTMTNTHSLTEIYIQYTNNKRVWLATLHELRTCPHPHSSTLMRKPRAHQGENKVNSRRNSSPSQPPAPTASQRPPALYLTHPTHLPLHKSLEKTPTMAWKEESKEGARVKELKETEVDDEVVSVLMVSWNDGRWITGEGRTEWDSVFPALLGVFAVALVIWSPQLKNKRRLVSHEHLKTCFY